MWGGKKARKAQKIEEERFHQAMASYNRIGGFGGYKGSDEDCIREIADRVSGYTGRMWKYNSRGGYHSLTVNVYTGGQDYGLYMRDIEYDIRNAISKAAREIGCPFEIDYEIEFSDYSW